ncbi:hypothetical protein [Chromatium okenii]|uniref:Uncharacterized protein n=2 Tax=Chromatium okenii TaxID=61644 RepID=A0A2S7XV35_9GAMM|nr:hypothetical protein [Chromatium okenii]PQJ97627.1 hypothetical protein CXB77_00475 [Chromatium okenii]
MKQKKIDHLNSLATTFIADKQTAKITEASNLLLKDADRLRFLAEKWKNVAPGIAQGRQFEQLSVARFNLDALEKGRTDVRAYTTDSVGKPHDPVDIIVQQGRKKLSYQAKSCNKAVSSLNSLTDKLDESKYQGLLRLPPSEQYEKIEALLKQRVEAGTLKQAQYEDTLRNLRKELSLDGVSSGSTTHAEAMRTTTSSGADQVAKSIESKSIRAEMHRSGLEAGKTGALISGGISSIDGLLKLGRGEAEIGEVVAQVAVDAAKGYVIGYATTAISKGIPHALVKTGVAQNVINGFTKGNAHLAIAAGVVQSGKSIVSYLNGDINSDQLLTEISETAITGASAFYYGALGQAIIPVPILGAFIGSTVGYFVGSMLHQSGLISLGESSAVKASRERREHIEALCLTAIPLMQAHRFELEAIFRKNFAERHQLIASAFDSMDNALTAWDADQFNCGLEKLTPPLVQVYLSKVLMNLMNLC